VFILFVFIKVANPGTELFIQNKTFILSDIPNLYKVLCCVEVYIELFLCGYSGLHCVFTSVWSTLGI